jgi:signal transduction histidine kinase
VLDNFVHANRDAIIARSRARVAARTSPSPTEVELTNGIPVFLDQVGDALRMARSSGVIDHEQLAKSAGLHGSDLFRMGLSIGQVVHDYGDVCQTVTELAMEQNIAISGEDFRWMNLCLDDAIAGAVTEYARLRERASDDRGTERLGILAHELRNLLNTGTLAYESLKRGQVAIGGSTGQLLGRSLMGLAVLVDRSVADVRLDAGLDRHETIVVAELVEEIEIGASMQAQARGVHLIVVPVARDARIVGDRQILAAAIGNLLQNGFKFSRKGGTVTLTTRATDERVLFEIEDMCGGLPGGVIEELFVPFTQRGGDRSGLGLGLTICLKAARANAGEMSARDLPGKGCVFTLNLPRKLAK